MKLILGIIIGIVVGTGGLALAQFWSSTDGQGNQTSGYTDQFGNSTYTDSLGRSGSLYQLPPAAAIQPRNPCYHNLTGGTGPTDPRLGGRFLTLAPPSSTPGTPQEGICRNIKSTPPKRILSPTTEWRKLMPPTLAWWTPCSRPLRAHSKR